MIDQRWSGSRWFTLAALATFLPPCLPAQTTSSVTIRLLAPDGTSITDGRVKLENRVTGFHRELMSDGTGAYSAENVPLQTCQLVSEALGFESQTQEVALRTNVPFALDVTMPVSSVHHEVVVSAQTSADWLDVMATGTRTALSAAALDRAPAALGSRGMETYLLTFPGFAMNANGAIHPRGAHNQMTFVIDGMPINDQLTGAFATALDPNIVDGLELYTGDVPAEFGSKVSGVAAVSSRSGAGSGRRFFGNAQLGAGAFDTLQTVTQIGGETGRFAYFASFTAVKSNRFLDQVSFDNLHNAGNSERAFLRLDYQAGDRDRLGVNVMTGRSSFQVANLRSQHAVGMDQRQLLRDASVWVRWNRVLNPSATWESTLAYRPTVSQLLPSPFDTPVTASQARHLNTITSANRLNWVAGAHSFRGGVDIQHFPVSENFFMAITSPNFNDPSSEGFNDALLRYDLSRGGEWFRFSRKQAGSLYSAFLQDSVKWGRLVFSLGMRYDNYRFLVNGNQLQPRLGVAFHLKETGTVLRASYNRNYQTPPNENLLLSSSDEAARLAPRSVREALGNTFVPLRPQRENVYEIGVQQALFGKATLNTSFYHKNSGDQQDNNNFFDTGIIFPVALSRIRVNGAEARLTLPAIHGITGTVSATHSRAVTTPPFTGGLFLGQDAVDLLSAGPFVIDHDQKLSVQGTVQYALGRNWWTSTSIRYDSGLVANPSDPAEVAADPDYRDLLPYVHLLSDPPRVTPRTITDVAIGYQGWRGDRRAWDVQVQMNNLFNVTGLYNFQSVFVGTRLVAPRAAGVKVRFFW
jgi:outer membrane cobalamin receptor